MAGEGPLARKLADDGRVSGREAVAAAQEGDATALGVFDRFARWLGLGIASFINTFEPERVVIGGGLSRAADLFLDAADGRGRAQHPPGAVGAGRRSTWPAAAPTPA